MLIYTTSYRAIRTSNSERRHCETLLSYCWTHQTSPRGWTPPSLISPITAERGLAYENDSFHYVMKEAESEQLVGVPCYQWSLRHPGLSLPEVPHYCLFSTEFPLCSPGEWFLNSSGRTSAQRENFVQYSLQLLKTRITQKDPHYIILLLHKDGGFVPCLLQWKCIMKGHMKE